MEKLLIDSCGDYIVYDPDTNSIKDLPTCKSSRELYLYEIYVADDAGQAITDREVIDYNKGDLVIMLYFFKGEERINKVLVCSDPFVAADFNKVLEEYNDEESE